MRDAEFTPAFAEHIVTHLTDGAVVMQDFGRFHQDVEIKGLGVELHRSFQIRNRDADVRECKCDHGRLLLC